MSRLRILVIAFALGTAGAIAIACSSDDDGPQPPAFVTDGGPIPPPDTGTTTKDAAVVDAAVVPFSCTTIDASSLVLCDDFETVSAPLFGFEQSTLGPRDVTGSFIGGAKKINLNVELQAPFPGAGNDKTLRVYGFVDAGNVFGEREALSFRDLRSSYGLGLSWISPVGPLRLAIANPIRKQPGDRIQKLQFQIGTSF